MNVSMIIIVCKYSINLTGYVLIEKSLIFLSVNLQIIKLEILNS